MKLIFLIICVGLFLTVNIDGINGRNDAEEGHCVWYGQCYIDESKTYNCPYNGTAKELHDSKALGILKELCPDLVGENETSPKLCCDSAQISSLEAGINMARPMISRCPSCFRNFAQLWCQQACSPVNSKFVEVTEVKESPEKKKYISIINYHLMDDFAFGMYNSCQNVQNPMMNLPAFSVMCQGCSSMSSCTVDKCLSYWGTGQYAPFTIIFVRHQNESHGEIEPLNSTIIPCDRAPDSNSSACSCQDCLQACAPVGPYPAPDESHCYVGKMDCFTFLAILLFCGILLAIIIITILHYVIMHRKYPPPQIERAGPPAITVPGDVMLTEKDVRCYERIGAWTESKLEKLFANWGRFCSKRPIIVFLFGISISIICSCGFFIMEVTTDPVKLWSAPNSRARLEKDFFDSKFGPFYRTEQIIIVPKNQTKFYHENYDTAEMTDLYSAVYEKEFMHEILNLQLNISNLEASYMDRKVKLLDICFQPLAPDNLGCTIMSVTNYFQNNASLIDYEHLDLWEKPDSDYLWHLKSCLRGPTQVEDDTIAKLPCLAEFGGPIFPYVVLGGYDGQNYTNASAVVITFIVNNHVDPKQNEMAIAWEAKFIEFMKNYTLEHADEWNIAFSSERSVQDEIDRQSHSDVSTIIISYMVMFVYIALALGQYKVHNKDFRYLLLKTKIILGLAGVIIVLLCVTSSIGFYAYCGVPATLIIAEVIPFLVLAVGVDNIFILVQAYQRDLGRHQETIEEKIGRISGEVIPSMMLSSLSEVCCFFLGALSSMPAVRVFSLYAAMAIFFDFFLQITCFLALFVLDVRREESGRLEMICCVKVQNYHKQSDGFLYSLVKHYYTPALLNWKAIRIIIVVIFVAWFCISVSFIDKIELGLDQTLSMPDDSYVLQYFKALAQYLSVGPPVYFVVKGSFDYGKLENQNLICGSAGCYQSSLYGQVSSAAGWSNRSYIAHPVTSWLDDYFDWLQPGNPPCCRLYNGTEEFCPATVKNDSCVACEVKTEKGRPESSDFFRYINDFLIDNPGIACPKGGHAAYGDAIHFDGKDRIDASYFMTYHTVLKNSSDYINALLNARKITDNITEMIQGNVSTGVTVFPYSVFYVFYEQYLTIVHEGLVQLSLSILAIFIVSTLLLGLDPWSGAVIVLTITMILIDLLGLMYWWQIPFNAISLVNLVMAVGISVEFCAHIVRSFAVSMESNRVERAKESLATMGSSVLSGITLTKFGGIVVLAFSHSKIFKIFYFRMYLGIVVFGALHGLVFLPVLLSFIGPPVNKRKLLERQMRQMQGSPNPSSLTSRVGSYESDQIAPMISNANSNSYGSGNESSARASSTS